MSVTEDSESAERNENYERQCWIRETPEINVGFRIRPPPTIIWRSLRWKDLEKNGIKMACYISNGRFRSHETRWKLCWRGEKSKWHLENRFQQDSSYGWRHRKAGNLEKNGELNKAVTAVTTDQKGLQMQRSWHLHRDSNLLHQNSPLNCILIAI